MPGHTCVVCGTTPTQDPDASFHRLPSDPERRASWLDAFGLEESQLKAQSRVCCRHFRDGNAKNEPIVSLGKRFASPVKSKNPRHEELHVGSWSPVDVADITRVLTPSSLCYYDGFSHLAHRSDERKQLRSVMVLTGR